jgi:hypothetical protein
VYPNTVITIGDQLTSSRRSWHAYLGGMGDQPCRHPASDGADDTAQPGAAYLTRHNPFVYFHSLLDLGDCVADDVDLSRLDADLQSAAKTPSYSFIAPGPCPAGTELACADAFLKEWVPKIRRSPAYRKDGAIVVAFLSSATASGAAPPATGALVLSRFATRGKQLATPYDPFSLLRSLDDLFGVAALGRAQQTASFAKAALPRAF